MIPDVKPGYMRDLLPESAPLEAEDWGNIFNDIERVIMPGVRGISECDVVTGDVGVAQNEKGHYVKLKM